MSLNVFIGWSGRRSRLVAEKLTSWLKEVIPNLDTWMSDKIRGGTLSWFENQLNKELRRADFAVMCVSPENWDDPWLSYEPGVVLGQTETEKRIWPYVIDPRARRRDMPEPLKFFWAEMANYDGTFKLVEELNEAAGGQLSKTALKRVFKKKWPELEEVLKAAAPPPPPPCASDYIDDFMKVSQCIEMHQHRLYGRFYEAIDRAIAAIKAGTYDSETTFRQAVGEIHRSKEKFRTDNSLLVGNVADFFGENYSEEDLRVVLAEMESLLVPYKKRHKPPNAVEQETIRKTWITRMRQVVLEVFSEFQSELVKKLKRASKSAG